MSSGANGGDVPPGRQRRRRESITVSFEARDYLAEQEVSEELVSGATNAVATAPALAADVPGRNTAGHSA